MHLQHMCVVSVEIVLYDFPDSLCFPNVVIYFIIKCPDCPLIRIGIHVKVMWFQSLRSAVFFTLFLVFMTGILF
jgi:hypothetical protein